MNEEITDFKSVRKKFKSEQSGDWLAASKEELNRVLTFLTRGRCIKSGSGDHSLSVFSDRHTFLCPFSS